MKADLSTRQAVILRKSKRGEVQPASPKSKRDGHSALGLLAFGLVIILLASLVLPLALPNYVSANPAFTARAETYADAEATADLTVTKPTDTVDGDILFTFVMWRTTAGATIDGVPAGWTKVADYVDGGNIDKYAVYYKIASSEGANYAWSLTASSKFRVVCSCYTSGDFDPADPIDVVSNTAYRTSNFNVVAASMSVSTANSPLIIFAGMYTTETGGTFTKPTTPTDTWVEDDDSENANSDFHGEICSMIWTGSGATGTMTAVNLKSTDRKHAFAVALNPLPPPTPTVVTGAATDISYTIATLNGNVTDDGGANVTIRGFQYDTDTGAPYAYDWHEHGSWIEGVFDCDLTDLACNQTIYYRAYATNSAGTSYGGELNLTTTECFAPTIVTGNETDVGCLWGNICGNITDIGSGNVTHRGFSWGTSPGDYVWNWGEYGSWNETGVYCYNVTTGITTCNQTIYFKAWAANWVDYGYGGEESFTTTACDAPTVETDEATDVGYTGAVLHGNITNTGGPDMTMRGFEWDTDDGTPPFTYSWNQTGTYGTGVFDHELTSLLDGQTYWFRAFGVGPGGTGYGDALNFTTLDAIAPIVTSSAATNITIHTAIAYGNVTAIGGQNVTTRGFDWGYETGNYTVTWNETGNWDIGEFSHTLPGLTSGAVVYWLAWAVNTGGRGNSTELSFEVGELPQAPDNFAIEHGLLDIYVMTWDTGFKADITLIVGNEGHYPTSPTDGYILYSGNATTYVLAGFNPDLQTCYFRAYSYNDYGYSLDYAEDWLGDRMGLAATIFCVVMAGFALWKKGWTRAILSVSLLIFGVTTISYDIKFAIVFLAIGIVLFFMAIIRQISVAREGGEA